jgi:hypothetical protein
VLAKGVKDRFGPVTSSLATGPVTGFRSGRQIAGSSKLTGIKSFARKTLMGTVLAVVAIMVLMTSVASAGPVLDLMTLADTAAAPGGTIDYFVTVRSVGDQPTDGSPLTLQVTFPAGLTATSVSPQTSWDCSGSPLPTLALTCTFGGIQDPSGGDGPRSSSLEITASVDPSASGTLTSSFALSGGGAPDVLSPDPTQIDASTPGFGVDAFDAQVTANPAGDDYTQAGGHPYAATTSILFNTITNSNPFLGELWPVEPTKDIAVQLPLGFVVDPTATGQARCTPVQLAYGSLDSKTLCPPGSQVGVTTLFSTNGQVFGDPLPVFNLVPPAGVPARLGFNILGSVVTLDGGVVRVGGVPGGYGLSANVTNIPEALALAGTKLTLWGVPADPRHNAQRACPNETPPGASGPTCATEAPLRPLLRNPTFCTPAGVGLPTALSIDSWAHPGVFKTAVSVSHDSPGYPATPQDWGAQQGPTGCDLVPFSPSLSGAPDLAAAGAPAAFSFDVTLPQSEDPDAIATGDLKSAVVTLPPGLRTSASIAGGLQGCSSVQIGLQSQDDATCPAASKIGTVTIDTPLLDDPLSGSIYLAKPFDNPSNSLLAVYLVAKGPGVILKLDGGIAPDPKTGQITTTFDSNPQLPFSKLHLAFKGGPRAPLSVPRTCGTQKTHAVLTSWSGKTVTSDSDFTVSGDGYGSPCSASNFSPQLTVGTESHVSGAFSPLSLRLQRTDTDEEFRALSSLSLPPGLLADVGSVSVRCTEAQADAHACPAESHIGTVNVGAGAGPNPTYVPGDVYLMGGFSSGRFAGDPFGLAVVVHATAGPFDLGYVVVKAGIQVHDDGSITTQTEPFPSILEGIPLQLKDIRVSLDRPHFIVNPTNCNQMWIAGTVTSTEGQSAGVSSRFQVGECANLAFKPAFTVSTAGKTSKANGASLHVHLATHQGPGSTGTQRESNIAKVDVQLPVVLPARLPTLQKACTAAQFGADPAGCPVGSFVGTAIAHTPILASPLSGPAILVSHGGEAFPDLVLVLQGEGVRINLTGHTQIKKGITYNHFETVPDAPVSSFDLTLPAGPHGVLTTDIPGRNLCATTRTVTVTKRITRRVNGHTRRVTVKAKKAVAAPLQMPTTITAQNGAVLKQTTKIAVTGCAKAKAAKHKARRRK